MRQLTDETLDAVATRFKVLSEPTRLRLLRSLQEGEKTVGELVDELDTSQANVSRHLGLLRRHQMVDRRKEGPRRVYRIVDESIVRLCELVCGRLEEEVRERHRALEGDEP